MKKIMFSDKYGLTKAVLEGRKTMTRRIVPQSVVDYYAQEEDPTIIDAARYEIGEVIAIAQSYKEVCYSPSVQEIVENKLGMSAEDSEGWNNKMFVSAKFMPHHIGITDIKVERLQDISREDMLKEGIRYDPEKDRYVIGDISEFFQRDAFYKLINKVSGKGTWAKNPWVFAYEFELID